MSPQRLGPEFCDMPQLIEALDRAVQPILDEAVRQWRAVWIVNEYAHVPVNQVIEPNRDYVALVYFMFVPGRSASNWISMAAGFCGLRSSDCPRLRVRLGLCREGPCELFQSYQE